MSPHDERHRPRRERGRPEVAKLFTEIGPSTAGATAATTTAPYRRRGGVSRSANATAATAANPHASANTLNHET